MMKIFVSIVVLVAIILAIMGLTFVIVGPAKVWNTMAGPADLGPMDIANVQRTSAPHDALACTEGLCTNADMDLVLPEYAQSPEAVIKAFETAARAHTPSLERVDDRSDRNAARFVTRSPTMKFPDTTWVQAQLMENGQTGLRIYARAQLGRSDLGKNLERITAWASALSD